MNLIRDAETQLEIETTKEIIMVTALEYDMPLAEWLDSLEVVSGNEEAGQFLTERTQAFIEDVMSWARYENIPTYIIKAAVRSIYEEC